MAGRDLVQVISAAAETLPPPHDDRFGQAFDRFAEHRVVLLGEASHGTAEFYAARAAITRRLVERHGFRIVAVEADWPDAQSVNRYVRGLPRAGGEETPFQRFPTWMWRNTEVAQLVGWLRGFNAGRADGEQAGFYGLDLYNMGASIEAVLRYLEEVDPEAAAEAETRYGCLQPWSRDPAVYGRAVLSGYSKCEEAALKQCRELLERRLEYGDGESYLDAAASARLVASAERYYRTMYYGGPESWNLRDTHMFETLCQLLEAHGPDAKAVVWAHNSHIGDARATEMSSARGELNLGQLTRERFGEKAALIGFGTHTGTVAAATDWGGEMEVKRVRPSREDSWERPCHETGIPRFLLDLRAGEARDACAAERLERFIGVIYRPETELMSHYMDAALSRQFDAWAWFDETSALTPLAGRTENGRVPDTFAFGT